MCNLLGALIGGAQITKGIIDYNKTKKDSQNQANRIKNTMLTNAQITNDKANSYQENNKVMQVPTKIQTPINSSTTSAPTQQRQLGLNLGA